MQNYATVNRAHLRKQARGMSGFALLPLAIALLFLPTVTPVPPAAAIEKLSQKSLESWVRDQRVRALSQVRAAISPPDGAKGSVMASPSRSQPDYYYHWVRDAALVMRDLWRTGKPSDPGLQSTLRDFAIFSRLNQKTPNPSGGVESRGLGEPKFHMDGSAYTGAWGRPQNDGPALRAITLIEFARGLLAMGRKSFVASELYRAELPAETVIKADLEYVAHHWRDPSFDLWEEVLGDHFYTRMVQRLALLEGAELATRLGDAGAALFYREQARLVERSIEEFWSPARGHVLTTLRPLGGDRGKSSQLDIATILAVLHGTPRNGLSPLAAGRTRISFSASDPRIVATAERLFSAFERLYPINQLRLDRDGAPMAPAIGRYPEDEYDGIVTGSIGHPWFLTTHAMAEYCLLLRQELLDSGVIELGSGGSRVFYERLLGLALDDSAKKTGLGRTKRLLPRSDKDFSRILTALASLSDQWLRRSRYHTASDGSQAEQYDRGNGYMRGARDLTWSYASFLSLTEARSSALRGF
jgi:glucoamylase